MTNYSLLNYINGEWTGEDLKKIEVVNPATGEVIGSVPSAGKEEALVAIKAANDAFRTWSALPAIKRAEYLFKLQEIMLDRQEELAKIMTLENGKPLKEARGEVLYATSFLQWFGEEARRIYGRTIPGKTENHRMSVIKQPVGVVAAITPWNFPAAMITRKMAPALAAGCTFIVKPSELTPLSALKIAECCEEAGIPKGVFNVVCGEPKGIGEAFMTEDVVRKITFTGSTAVGKLLLRQSAEGVKKASMELGGHAPFIVCDDADIDLAVENIVAAKFRNSGQVCVSPNRLYVQSSIYESFISKFAEKAKSLKVGNGLDEDVNVGPLIEKKGYEKVVHQVYDAIEKGATCVLGGKGTAENGAYFYQPTILKDVTSDMEIMNIETFGPVAPIQKFETIDEALRLANDTPFGLAAYFFTTNVSTGTKLSEGLDYGIVGWNDALPSTAEAPFGGIKHSGLGSEGGTEGIEEYLETKYISMKI
ncbi:NAD-dependent succinate-semialdehyde dehydrogenase [Terrilactibacillus laevilacticus]|uniref:NAD-dependent succinate-semialdehyde dehydrogenase n=1 Tax=Terrilactibacillus laevilacticus TaxID=1380157 RepID=A0ABW5PQM2_9BACI|nr:NAD-dependent succinate-semialdehyde dehydrogenase [Terrilactibacillus laevilacticus]